MPVSGLTISRLLRSLTLGGPTGGAEGYSTEAQQFFDRVSDPGTTRKDLYAAMIDDLVSAGVWAKLDVLQMYAAADAATALTNLIQSSFGGTEINSPTFTADQGYITSGNPIDIGFNPTTASGNFSQDSASIGVWIKSVGIGGQVFKYSDGDTGVQIWPRFGDGKMYLSLNSSDDGTGQTTATSAGFSAGSRNSSSSYDYYKNGSNIGTRSAASTSLHNSVFNLDSGDPMCSVCGGGLDDTEQTALYDAIHTYLQAVAGVA